jgi:hypothetical protein
LPATRGNRRVQEGAGCRPASATLCGSRRQLLSAASPRSPFRPAPRYQARRRPRTLVAGQPPAVTRYASGGAGASVGSSALPAASQNRRSLRTAAETVELGDRCLGRFQHLCLGAAASRLHVNGRPRTISEPRRTLVRFHAAGMPSRPVCRPHAPITIRWWGHKNFFRL